MINSWKVLTNWAIKHLWNSSKLTRKEKGRQITNSMFHMKWDKLVFLFVQLFYKYIRKSWVTDIAPMTKRGFPNELPVIKKKVTWLHSSLELLDRWIYLKKHYIQLSNKS